MPIGLIIVVFVVVGVVLYLVNRLVPMTEPVKTALNIVVALLLCVWVLNILGFTDYTLPTPHRAKL